MRPGSWLSMKNGALGGALLVHASDGVGASSAGDLVSHKVVRCTGAPRTLIAPWQPACTSQTACICRCHFASAARCLRGLDAGAFINIGYSPQTAFLPTSIQLDSNGCPRARSSAASPPMAAADAKGTAAGLLTTLAQSTADVCVAP